jgi:hypothetical protein
VVFSRWRDAVVSSSSELPSDDELTSVLAFHGQPAFLLGWWRRRKLAAA